MRQFGYTIISSPEKTVERDLFTCGHCQLVVTFSPSEMPEDAGGMCKQCNRLICRICYGKDCCDPFENKIERIEAREASLRSMGI